MEFDSCKYDIHIVVTIQLSFRKYLWMCKITVMSEIRVKNLHSLLGAIKERSLLFMTCGEGTYFQTENFGRGY